MRNSRSAPPLYGSVRTRMLRFYPPVFPGMKTSLFLCLALSPLTLLANGLKAPGPDEEASSWVRLKATP